MISNRSVDNKTDYNRTAYNQDHDRRHRRTTFLKGQAEYDQEQERKVYPQGHHQGRRAYHQDQRVSDYRRDRIHDQYQDRKASCHIGQFQGRKAYNHESQYEKKGRLNRPPENVDIIPIESRIEQNLILSDIKKIFDISLGVKSVNLHLDESHTSILQNKLHLVTFNTGKCPFWLYLINRNNRQCSFLIDKQLSNIWLIKSQFLPEFYTRGTLFEASLLQVEKEFVKVDLMLEEQLSLSSRSPFHLVVLIHDTLVANGKNISSSQLDYRYNQTVEIFKKSQYSYQSYDYIEYNFKPYFKYHEIESAWYDYLPKVNYLLEVQGILFRPIDNAKRQSPNYYFNVDPDLKRPNKYVQINGETQTINLLVKKTDSLDTYHLYALDRDRNLKYIDIAVVNDIATSKMLQHVLSSKESAVFVCNYDEYFKKWKPIEVYQAESQDIICNFTEKLTS